MSAAPLSPPEAVTMRPGDLVYWTAQMQPHKCRGCGRWTRYSDRVLVARLGRLPQRVWCLGCGPAAEAALRGAP